ncbi:hypothetical protein [Rhodanobacter lindaniclasticus]
MNPQPRTSRGAPQAAPLLYGSVCSGIEAASLAWQPLGLEAVWFAEIEPFPSAVLAHRYPRAQPGRHDRDRPPGRAGTGRADVWAGGHRNSHANAGVVPAIAFAQNNRGEVRYESGDDRWLAPCCPTASRATACRW